MRARSDWRRRRARRTLWSLAVLGLPREKPMPPYEMQRQMHVRYTDDLLALKRGSLYHAINQLQRDGLIEPVETSREGRRPERTVYRISPDGEDELILWLRDLLSTPVREPSQFMTALAHMLQLEPPDALQQLRLRSVNLDASIAAMHAVERGVGALVGRGAIIEVEYARALLEAELAWVRSVIDDLKSGALQWSFEELKSNVNYNYAVVDKQEQEDTTS